MAASFGIGLLCSTHSLGGIELNVLRFAEWMRARGHRPLIIGSDDAPLLEEARKRDLPLAAIGKPGRYVDLAAARRLSALLDAHDLDILHLHITRDLTLGVLTRLLSKRSITLLHTQHMQFGKRKTDMLHRVQHARLAAWVAPLPRHAAETRTHTTIDPARIHVIPFGIDLRPFASLPDRRATRSELGLPEDAVIIGVVGRLDQGKGQEYVLRAAARLRDEGLPMHVLLVGEDTRAESQDYGAHLRGLARELGIQDALTMHGFTHDIVPLYAAMDCFVLSSIAETYGMVTIEAMAACLPVIGTDSGGTPDIVREGETGLLVPPRDPDALADALRTLLADRPRMRAFGEAGRRLVHEQFTHLQQCERYEQLYEAIRMP